MERILRERLTRRDPASVGEAVTALAALDRPETVLTLAELLANPPDPSHRTTIAHALMRSRHSMGVEIGVAACGRLLADRIAAWQKRGAPLRGAPTRWGDPCSLGQNELFPRSEWRAQRPERGPRGTHDAIWPRGLATALRNLTLRVRPDLDAAIVVERFPALDALTPPEGHRPYQLFVNGDAYVVPIAGPGSEPAPEEIARLSARIEEALEQPRTLEVYLDGRRHSLEYVPGEPVDLAGFLNRVLVASGSSRQLLPGAGLHTLHR